MGLPAVSCRSVWYGQNARPIVNSVTPGWAGRQVLQLLVGQRFAGDDQYPTGLHFWMLWRVHL